MTSTLHIARFRMITSLKRFIFTLMSFYVCGTQVTLAQPVPAYQISIGNPVLSGSTYQFDVYLKRTGTVSFRLGNSQFLLSMNGNQFSSPAISRVSASEQIGGNYFFDQVIVNGNEIRITIGGNDSYATASDISSTEPGTRIATYQISGVNVPVLAPAFVWINLPAIVRTGISEINSFNQYRDITDPTGSTHMNGGSEFARLSGYVFNDLNGNRTWNQPAEPGLNGWTITLNGSRGSTSATSGSGSWAEGYYEFDNLTPGEFTILQSSQSGWYPTVMPSGPLVLGNGAFSQNNLFGEYNGPNPYGLDVSTVSSDSGFSGYVTSTVFSVLNTGNLQDSMSLLARDSRGWVLTPLDSVMFLSAGQGVNVRIWSTIPASQQPGSVDTVWLIARSRSAPGFRDSSYAIVTVLSVGGSVLCGLVDGWNLISLPVEVDDYSKAADYPTATSYAFGYDGSYTITPMLERGRGYWLKFASVQNVNFSGGLIVTDTVDVKVGWNLIGSISRPLMTGSVSSIPGGIVTSRFFTYRGNYLIVDTIEPGKGYWVKVTENGKLVLSSTHGLQTQGAIRMTDIDELPPSPPTGGMKNEPRIPKSYVLGQNYPNPFNPSTVIDYALPASGHVRIIIYDMLGQEVRRIVDETQEAGYKSVKVDMSGLASGVYTYRIVTGTFTGTRRMVLVR